MAPVTNVSNFTPYPSLMDLPRGALNAVREDRCCPSFPRGYATGTLTALAVVTLPFALVIDPIVGIFETFANTQLAIRDLDNNNPLTGRAVLMNLRDKVLYSPFRHLKMFLISATIAPFAAVIFYFFSVVSTFFFNCAYIIPTVGSYLGCAVVTCLMHLPMGMYGECGRRCWI